MATTRSVGGDTRRTIMTQLLKRGPVTATELGAELGLTPAGVRRHLDALIADALVETCEANTVAGAEVGRGRPAKYFRLTDQGRSHFGDTYDELALDAVDLIESLGGDDAVRAFAQGRIAKILRGVRGEASNGAESAGAADVEDADGVKAIVAEVAAALEEHGYATSVTRAGGGIQICQHHCPVSAVAAKHPELCDAEHEAISQLVGRHVQPLALIANGHGICTTNIPLAAPASAAGDNYERSGNNDES
ncbi:MarR family protein [Corynebacterium glaucum]|uniref:helix-turn-helix transcriptional regulator n=1 Tax=Corynebacterium glaucum TaxID=187491 RepID=UPI0025B2AB47|nr:metalloregulator ArsR/SmtB family transcription factor [Corynebacterium glaucum]WJZ07787.1 MarR family protein [Corynebacterium glaucum]